MSDIINRALAIVNDDLTPPIGAQPVKPAMARGGYADGGDPVDDALEAARDAAVAPDLPPLRKQPRTDTFSGRVMKPAPVDAAAPDDEGITAYHGTPHKFDEFDLTKIGTGEGAQAYGHGLYFAENEDVAKQYRKQLASDTLKTPDGEIFDPQMQLKHLNVRATARNSGSDLDAPLARAKQLLPKANEQTRPLLEEDIATLQGLKDKGGVSANPGHMYEVRLNAGPEHLLDWDKPLSEQHPKVQEALSDMKPEHTGALIYESSRLVPGDFMDKVAATEALKARGIRGIRYRDAGSRGQDEESASHNIVIFAPQHIKVKRRYAQGGDVPESDDEGIVAYAFGNSVPHIEQRIAGGEFPEIEKSVGGAIDPIELRDDNLEDMGRRLILWSAAVAPVTRPLSRSEGGAAYPVAMPTEIKEDLKSGEAHMRDMSPQEFLDEAAPLHIGKGDRHIINSFERHIKSGDPLGPLKLYEEGHQDGRHRANAAKALGIKKVPVVDYRKAGGGSIVNKAFKVLSKLRSK